MVTVAVVAVLPLFVAGDIQPPEGRAALTLRTASARLALDRTAYGAVVSLKDAVTGREFIAAEPQPDLFAIGFSEAGETPGPLNWLAARDAQGFAARVDELDGARTARLDFRNLGGRGIDVECTVTARRSEEALLWEMRISGPDSLVLEEVSYPILALRTPLGEGPDDDAVVAGLTKGGVFRAPSRWRENSVLYSSQPGGLAAQFCCHYGPGGGVYSATRDSEGYPKAVQFRRTNRGLELKWRRFCYHRLSSQFEPGYPIAVQTFRSPDPARSTDWRDAADIYKAWALRQPWCARTLAEREDLPDWLRTGPAMVRFTRQWLAHPERIETWLRDCWRRDFPPAPLIVAFWGWEHVDTWISPHYFPPYPSEQGLARIVRAVGEAGGHPFFWPSGYHWAVTYRQRRDGSFEWDDRDEFEAVGAPHAVVRRGGSLWGARHPWLGGGMNRGLCRGDAWTRQWLDRIAVGLTRRGADLIQIDQVVGALGPNQGRCYSARHGHPVGPGLWDTKAFGEQLRSMRHACAALNPQLVLGFEEPQELFIQQVGIQDYRDTQKPWSAPVAPEPASVFGYLYHEFLPCFQSNPRPGDRRTMAYCLVNGQMPHIAPQWPVGPSAALRNGSFEEWDGGVPDGWERVKGYRGQAYSGLARRDGSLVHGGRASLRLTSAGVDEIAQVSQNVPIGPEGLNIGDSYRFSVWFRGPSFRAGNAIVLGAFDSDWNAKAVWRVPLTPSAEWRKGGVTFGIPPGAVRLRIMLHLIGPGEVWLDDVTLEEHSPDGSWQQAMLPGLPPAHGLARRWVELFHGEGRPYLLLGRMLHPPRVEEPASSGGGAAAMLCNAYRAPDGSEALVLVNSSGTVRRCVVTWRGRERPFRFEPWEVRLVRAAAW